jgi:hypothetical protein
VPLIHNDIEGKCTRGKACLFEHVEMSSHVVKRKVANADGSYQYRDREVAIKRKRDDDEDDEADRGKKRW